MILKLFLVFLKIGFIGFGGGYAMLPLILEDSVKLGLSLQQFADLNALDMLIPGPIAINAATYVGYLLGNTQGAVVASVAVVIPSFIFVHLFTYLEETLKDGRIVQHFIKGVKIGAVGVIAASAYILFRELVFEIDHLSVFVVGSVSVCFFLQTKKDINPIILTVVFGLIGYVLYYLF